MTHTRTTNRRPSTGFSLMELLVVIAIISVIAGMLLGGIAVLRSGSQESQTRAILASLTGHRGQLETQFSTAAAMPSHLDNDQTYDWSTLKRRNAQDSTGSDILDDNSGVDLAGDANDDHTYTYGDASGDRNDTYMERANLYMKRFLWAANQMPTIRDGLPSLGESFGDIDGDGFIEVVDAWGNPIAYARSVKHNDPSTSDDDFLPERNGPFFASAGKDQRWGMPRVRGEMTQAEWDDYIKTDEYKFTLDNLYDFDIDRSAAQRGD